MFASSGKLGESSDKNERGEPRCPKIHPKVSWMKVRTDFHGLTFYRRSGHFSRESGKADFHRLFSSARFGSGSLLVCPNLEPKIRSLGLICPKIYPIYQVPLSS
jgi:hypothetical protein